ncbi:YihY/virulence factor BrkB family protein [Porphyrobacter sp. AAP82]|uniref:YihY/virulence factor BrkB family protein n=1 Tax=Porphyrobacter sp. AAP82 TaxID=1248917 RepID=UPI00030F2EE1|nr:YihY/virulence factor BrkB family protein [Porphyrobacter sp. AAP82]
MTRTDNPPLPAAGAASPFAGRAGQIARRVARDTFNDGFIHAGNLAYLGMLAIFPFFILGAALFDLIGGRDNAEAMILSVALALPGSVAETIVPVAEDVVYARSGWLLWAGGAVGLWTVSSLIETIRDILRRAYGTRNRTAFWKTRLFSAGIILGAVVVLMLSLFAQVLIGGAQEVIDAAFPQFGQWISTLRLSRIVPALGLWGSLFVLFITLTPPAFRGRRYPKWPGALFTMLWWLGVAAALPVVLRSVFTYDLTYGSLAGAMVTLLFFWLVGLGLVIGAELNAALALEGRDLTPKDAGEETV